MDARTNLLAYFQNPRWSVGGANVDDALNALYHVTFRGASIELSRNQESQRL